MRIEFQNRDGKLIHSAETDGSPFSFIESAVTTGYRKLGPIVHSAIGLRLVTVEHDPYACAIEKYAYQGCWREIVGYVSTDTHPGFHLLNAHQRWCENNGIKNESVDKILVMNMLTGELSVMSENEFIVFTLPERGGQLSYQILRQGNKLYRMIRDLAVIHDYFTFTPIHAKALSEYNPYGHEFKNKPIGANQSTGSDEADNSLGTIRGIIERNFPDLRESFEGALSEEIGVEQIWPMQRGQSQLVVTADESAYQNTAPVENNAAVSATAPAQQENHSLIPLSDFPDPTKNIVRPCVAFKRELGWKGWDLEKMLKSCELVCRDVVDHPKYALGWHDKGNWEGFYLQIIPYVVITNHEGQVLRYRRGKKGGEAQLHDQYSIGLGGHIDTMPPYLDVVEGQEPPTEIDRWANHLGNEIKREIKEEIGYTLTDDELEAIRRTVYTTGSNASLMKIIDPAVTDNPADCRHLGLLVYVTLDVTDINPEEAVICDPQFMDWSAIEETSEIKKLENWSQIAAQHRPGTNDNTEFV